MLFKSYAIKQAKLAYYIIQKIHLSFIITYACYYANFR